MRFLIGLVVSSLLILASCRKEKPQEVPQYVTDSSQLRTLKVDNPITPLDPAARELVQEWPEYQRMDEFIQQYQEITVSDALLNSKELSELAQQLKDSIRIEKLKIPSVKIRLNVLHNEAVRLADMATIRSIEEKEILEENNNVINAFSALNAKINNMQKQEMINKEIGDFIVEELTEKLDTTAPAPVPEKKRSPLKIGN